MRGVPVRWQSKCLSMPLALHEIVSVINQDAVGCAVEAALITCVAAARRDHVWRGQYYDHHHG